MEEVIDILRSNPDTGNHINTLFSIVVTGLLVPLVLWVGRFFQPSLVKEISPLIKDVQGTIIQITDVIQTISTEIQNNSRFLEHIHSDISKMRDEDPNMLRSQVVENIHFYTHHFELYLVSICQDELDEDIMANGDRITERVLHEHLDVFRKLKSMLENLVYRDKKLSNFMDQDVKDSFRYIATFIMSNLRLRAEDEEMYIKDIPSYYANWKSKFCSLLIKHMDTGITFREAMADEPDWGFSPSPDSGEVEFFEKPGTH